MLSKKKLLSRFDEFVTGISKEDNFLIMAHGDADGLCSATIASKALFKIVGKKPKHYRFMYYGEKNLSKKIPKILKEDKLNKVIVMDWSVDQTPDLVKSIEKHAEKILILDHHKVYKDMNSKKTLMIKAQWISSKDGSKYPATKMCYDLFSRHASLEELQWVCAVGIIADSSEKAWKNFMDKAFKKYSVKKKKLMRETVFGKIVEMIEALQAIGPYKFYSYVDLFFKADVPKKVLNSSLKKYSQELQKEVNYWFSRFKKEKEEYPELELLYFKFNPKYFIKSPLINIISKELYPNKTVLIAVQRDGSNLKISGRRQDFKVKINDMLEKSVRGLKKANAGGHIPAAAAMIQEKDEKKFKENVKDYLRKLGRD